MYAVAVNASEILFYLPTAAAAALLPAVARDPHGKGSERTLVVFRAVVLVTGAAMVLAATLGPLLIPVVFGEAYRGAVDPFLWLLPSALGFAASATLLQRAVASGRRAMPSVAPRPPCSAFIALDLVLDPRLRRVRRGRGGERRAAAAAAARRPPPTGAGRGSPGAALVPRTRDLRTLRLLGRRALQAGGVMA